MLPPDAVALDRFTAGLYRLDLEATEEGSLPAEKGTMLRGGFGVALKRTVCAFDDPLARDCSACPLRPTCVYPRLFEGRPPVVEAALDRDPPRPFVVRVPPDHRTRYRAGDVLSVEIVLVGWARAYLPYATMAVADLAEGGLGRDRARFALHAVWSLDPFGRPPLRLDSEPAISQAPAHVVDHAALLQRAAALSPDGVTVTFLTPTWIVADDRPLPVPTFPALAGALRRRTLALIHYHCAPVADVAGGRSEGDDKGGEVERSTGGAPPPPAGGALADPTAFATAAARIRALDDRVGWRARTRRSTRTGATMPTGGVVGTVHYAGDTGALAPFLPLLVLGEVAHVGKRTAFGCGRFLCSCS